MIEQFYDLRPEVLALDRKALDLCRAQFAHVEEIRDYNQLKMLRAFTDCGVEARHFWGSSGYGVWDDSRNKLEEVFARCMGAEAALVRPQFMSGTHTLTVALFGLLRTGDTLLAATGRPYDTLEGVIGIGDAGKGCGTLREFGVNYDECPLLPDFTPDYDLIAEKARTATVVHIQRSRGYTQRNAFDLATIQKVADTARKANPNAVIFVDNCYGEFTQTAEPVAFGADIMAGSFIKNPGGGITPTGGYIAGRKDLVEKCSHRFTAPGIGGDLGCTQDSLRDTFLGFYYAPGVVCEALKTAIYAQCLLEPAGKIAAQNGTAGSTAAGKRQRSGSGTGQAKNSTASDLHRKNLLQKTYRRGPAECQSREKVCGCSAAGRTLPGSKTQRTADGFDLIVTILAGFVKRKLSG